MRDEEGIAELKKEIAIRANGTTADESRSLIANPRRAREKYAPDFSLVSTAGEKFTVESLRGKVVLLDFWGTWCAPCVRAVPSLRKLHKEHAKDAFPDPRRQLRSGQGRIEVADIHREERNDLAAVSRP
jgi:thiol-disulfide isomerase/thioredoxin